MREFITRELGLKTENETELLALVGLDLPGAVEVVAETAPADHSSAARFEAEQVRRDVGSGEPVVRFSVAGVQLKLSMVADQKALRLPGRGELGGNYVKFPGSYPFIPENEYAMMSLASRCGIDIPEVRLVDGADLGPLPRSFERFRGSKVYVIERFDRVVSGEKAHIEDMNQVANQWPEQKYEGASYESLGRTIRALCGEEDFLQYVRRVAFNILVGNEDAHLKNWSLWYPDRSRPRLSPAYDIVSTVIYEDLARETGLKIGGSRSAHGVTLATFRRLVEKAGFPGAEEAEEVVRDVGKRLDAAVDDVRQESTLPDGMWTRWREYHESLPLQASCR